MLGIDPKHVALENSRPQLATDKKKKVKGFLMGKTTSRTEAAKANLGGEWLRMGSNNDSE